MSICKNCGKVFNIDHYKKKGVCSECGFPIETITPEEQKKVTKLSRVSVHEITGTEKKKQEQNLSPAKTVPNKLENPVSTVSKPPVSKGLSVKHNASATGTKQQNVLQDAKKVHAPIAEPKAPLQGNTSLHSDKTLQEDQEDPIFLNADGPLFFDEESPDEAPNDTSPPKTNDVENATKSSLPKTSFILTLIRFSKRRSELLKERLEADINYNFNRDSFYDDTPTAVPPEVDAIPVMAIVKVIACTISLLGCIALLVYYA